MLKSFFHTGFVVKDIEASIRFYADVLGMRIAGRTEREGEFVEQVLAFPGAHIKGGFVDMGEGLAIWDYAGAALICKEAGAKITDSESNPISYKPSAQRRQLVCAGSDELHNTILSLMSQ